MLKDFVKGTTYVLRGFKLISRPRIKRFVILPLLINTLVFSSVIYFGASELDYQINRLLPDWLDWAKWILWPLFALIVMGVVFFTFTLLTNLLGAPFNGYLAAAVEQVLTGKNPDAATSQTLSREIINSLLSELRKLAYFVIRAIPVLILMLVPFTNAVGAALWFLLGCWMLSIEYGDYPMANHNLLFAEQRQILAKRRWLALGFGAAVMLLVLIPVINFIAMPVAVAGATAMWLEELKTTRDSLITR